MNAITLLKKDHRTVEKLFKRFEKAGEAAYVEKREIVARVIEELSVHAVIEEQVFYPYVRRNVEGVEDDTLEALEEHHIVKWVLSELEGMDATDERYVAKTTVLIENVRHHVEEEEGELFPRVADALNDRQLDDLGERLDKARENAPKRPHPRSPDTPPGNLVTGPAAALADLATEKVRDFARSAIDRVTGAEEDVVEAASDAVDTVKDTATNAARSAKDTASKVSRSASDTADDAGDKVAKTARSARRSASRATRKVSSTTKRAAKRSTTKKASAATRSSTGKRATRPAKKAARAVERAARTAS